MYIPKYNLGRGPVFTFSLTGGAVRTRQGGRLPPVSYATDQVKFKHEQPQVLLIESHVESVRFSKGRTQPQRALSISTQ